MNSEVSERRRFKRVPLNLSIIGALPTGFMQNHRFEGETHDISFDGLRIKVETPNGWTKN